MTLTKQVGSYTAGTGGTSPNFQYQLTSNAVGNSANIVWNRTRVQDYDSFVFSFDIYTSNAIGDALWVFLGANSLMNNEASYISDYKLVFQVSAVRTQGIFLRDASGTTLAQSTDLTWLGTSKWNSVVIKYSRGNINTWVISYNGKDIITYNDNNLESWISSCGDTWGIGARTEGVTMDSYIRRLEMSYKERNFSLSSMSGGNLKNLKRFPEIALTGNSSFNCVASASTTIDGEPAYYAFDRNINTVWTHSWFTRYDSSGNFTSNTSTTIDGTAYLGDWLQIQLPSAIYLKRYKLASRYLARAPRNFVIGGSNDGTTWTLIDTRNEINNLDEQGSSFDVISSVNSYNYYRIVVTKKVAISEFLSIREWELYGIPVYGQIGAKYPIAALTADTTIINGNNIGCGTYTVTYSSSFDANFAGWKAFTNSMSDTYITTSTPSFVYDASGNYTASASTTISGTAYSGEWLQIQLPNSIALNLYTLFCRTAQPTHSPKTWYVAGSNDGSTWSLLDSETNITSWTSGVGQTFSVSYAGKYSYFRFVFNKANSVYAAVGELFLYDYPNMQNSISLNNVTPTGLINGLTWKYYPYNFSENPASFASYNYTNIGKTLNTLNINTATNGMANVDVGTSFSVEWVGYFRASVTGTYTFYTESDDWSYLWIDSTALSGFTTANALVNNGGSHPVQERSGTVTLYAGVYYPMRVQFGQGSGGVDCKISFAPPSGSRTYDGNGFYFSSIGTNQAYPAESAMVIKSITNTNTDGVYYINCNGVSTSTYCLMNDHYDGGGWMMLMKGTRGTTFNYSANYWTTTNTLNPTSTDRNDGDAKYNVFNYMPVKDVMAIFPDVPSASYTNPLGFNGGSLNLEDGWCWKINNWNGTTKTTPLAGLQVSRDAPPSNPLTFSGFSSNIYSIQTPAQRHIFGGGTHLSANYQVRWGFIFNENGGNDFTSIDVFSGIGMSHGPNRDPATAYSAGDAFFCCGTQALNRSMRFELFGR